MNARKHRRLLKQIGPLPWSDFTRRLDDPPEGVELEIASNLAGPCVALTINEIATTDTVELIRLLLLPEQARAIALSLLRLSREAAANQEAARRAVNHNTCSPYTRRECRRAHSQADRLACVCAELQVEIENLKQMLAIKDARIKHLKSMCAHHAESAFWARLGLT
jgi:hypothetical protein